MNKGYFHTQERQDILLKEVKEWIGTPFRHRAAVKKVGADCLHFVLKVYENVGALKNPLHFVPTYAHDWCHHTTEQKLYKGIKGSGRFFEIKLDNLINGDLVLYQFGLAASHCAIYFDRVIYQTINLVGVHKLLYIDKSWHRRRRFAFRVKNV